MKISVKSGSTLDDVKSFLKKLSDTLFRGLDKLIDVGLKPDEETKKELKTEKWPKTLKFHSEKGEVITVVAELADESGKTVNFVMKREGTTKGMKFKNIPVDKIVDTMRDNLARLGLGDLVKHEEVDSATKLRITLHRVSAGTEDEVQLTAINANCHPVAAMAIVDELAQSDEILDQLVDGPVTFSVVDEGDCFDVTPTHECVDTGCTYIHMLKAAMVALSAVQAVHWNAKGTGFFNLHNIAENYLYPLRYEIDQLAELVVTAYGHIDWPTTFVSDVVGIDTSAGFNEEFGYETLKTFLEEYLQTLECYYCNCPANVQHMLDNAIANWTHEVRYKLDRVTQA